MTETIIQALIVAAITAIVTGYVNGRVMEEKLSGMKETLKRLEGEILGVRQRIHDFESVIGWARIQMEKDVKFTNRYLT